MLKSLLNHAALCSGRYLKVFGRAYAFWLPRAPARNRPALRSCFRGPRVGLRHKQRYEFRARVEPGPARQG